MLVNPSSFSILEASQVQEYKYDFSCVLFPLPSDMQADFIKSCQEFVDPRDLSGKGIEESPHLTLRYGLHTNEPTEVQEILQGFGSLKFTMFFVSAFFGADSGKEFDVLKLDVLDPLKRLTKAHDALGILPNTETHSIYRPHVTIAYIKRGQAYKYIGKPFALSFFPVDSTQMIFSDRNGERHPINLEEYYE